MLRLLAALLILSGLPQSAPCQDSANSAKKPATSAQQQRGSDSLPITVKLLNTGESEKQTSEEAARIKVETNVLRSTLRWTRVLGASTIVLAIATILLWRATRGTLKHLSREFDAEHRPWVSIEISAAELRYTRPNPTKCALYLNISLANVGRAPAVRAFPRLRLYYFTGGTSDNPAVIQQRFVETIRANPKPLDHLGLTIFPGQTGVQAGQIVHMDEAALQDWRDRFDAENPHARFLLLGCVDYFSAISGSRHQTGLVREVHGPRLTVINPRDDRDVASDNITLLPSRFGDGVSD